MPIIHHHAGIQSFGAFAVHLFYHDNAFDPGTAAGISMNEINFVVVIPKRTRIYQAFTGTYAGLDFVVAFGVQAAALATSAGIESIPGATVVETMGLEPTTPGLQSRCSSS